MKIKTKDYFQIEIEGVREQMILITSVMTGLCRTTRSFSFGTRLSVLVLSQTAFFRCKNRSLYSSSQ